MYMFYTLKEATVICCSNLFSKHQMLEITYFTPQLSTTLRHEICLADKQDYNVN